MDYIEKLEYEKDILQTTLGKVQEIIKEFKEENKGKKTIHQLDIVTLSALEYELETQISDLEIEIINHEDEESEEEIDEWSNDIKERQAEYKEIQGF